MSVEALDTRADEKILPVRWRFFSTACLPLGLCFCEQSGGMTKTALPGQFSFVRGFPLFPKIPHFLRSGKMGIIFNMNKL